MTASANYILASLTVLAQILTVAMIAVWFIPAARTKLSLLLGRYALPFTFIIALIATSGSIFYSEIAGYEPCKLCWAQRIFMYPQIFLLGLGLWRKDRGILVYTLALSLAGTGIAAYHYLMQIGIAPSLPCAAVGMSASCSQRFIMIFGYITIPMMSLSAFALAATTTLLHISAKK